MSTQCQRPGCEGAYEDMGGGELYCGTCGLAPVVSPTGMVSSPPTGVAGGGRASSRDSSSQRSGSRASSRSSSRSSTSRRSVSGRLSRSLSGASTSRSVSVRSSGSTSATSARGRLGVGLVEVPDVPRPDPRTAVLENPEVPERKRFCSRSDCGAPVGRSRGDRPGRTEGFCTKCGHPYSFVPKLGGGDIVHGQYEVVGCLAHGGLGWVYLAVDRAVSDRWVVLKGLLDTGDQDAMAAAISERRFLAEIEHANIVRIYNFVEHLDQRTGSLDGYIVMEYVGGKALKEIANERRTPAGKRDPLPVEQACAYGIEALEALGHLHSRNLLYCDFKVDNAIQTEGQLKLIDMGAVRRMDDDESAIYGTVGYQAPEVAELGPSVASDLYTVARTLAVLTFDFQGYTNVFVDSLPDPDTIEVLRTYESFYRLLVRATDPDPARRFASAAEMAEQLTGVLREVVALQTGRPRPALSTLFGTELRVTDTELFAEQRGDVSELGARAASSRGGLFGRRRGGARPLSGIPAQGGAAPAAPPPPVAGALPSGAQPSGPASGPAGALPVGAQPSHPASDPAGADPLGAPPTHVRGGPQGGAPLTYAPPAHAPVPAPRTAEPAPGTAMGAAYGPTSGPAVPGDVRLVAFDARATSLALPVPRVDATDPNAGFLAGLMAAAPAELITALRAVPAPSPETRLRELRAWLEMRELDSAARALTTLEGEHPDDWRVVWYRGVTSLVTGDDESAALSFDAVYDAFPGETAPKLALGICAEVLGQLDNAAEYYRLVWATDPGYVSAAFGLARVQMAAGDRDAAVRTLESVPEASIHYTAARVAAVRSRLRERSPHEPLLTDLTAAAGQVTALAAFGLDPVRREQLSTEVLGKALDWVLSGSPGAPSPGGPETGPPGSRKLLGAERDERGLRFGLESSYRMLARLAQRGDERIELVERANRFRPRTWV
ncbi:serine/threonine protein kinase [Streptomyces sp. WZ.A104]|uniref:serine/threonine-protein kinase n=1 Tax=Streptomyces sp. WZ.A104 TaxID=2023771 RepID=UPI000BBB71B1|nr:serine/threonine-protein kinase [Streptomyces sp. WZ.A104]PCG82624.1 serine/threonine protein kinase [Streptomyces sp. WZ.A104]